MKKPKCRICGYPIRSDYSHMGRWDTDCCWYCNMAYYSIDTILLATMNFYHEKAKNRIPNTYQEMIDRYIKYRRLRK